MGTNSSHTVNVETYDAQPKTEATPVIRLALHVAATD